ncbi:MAG TPA: glycosyltransferase, partial [Candidatus Binatia bacterium]|nr:glycosyltransferase [Candidatus Binatia bacterium]
KFPRITVVTPSFNQASYLEATLNSVLDQGYPDLEYIVMDGGSTDGSVDILRRYASRLAYWRSADDDGQSDAINQGFARATGDIFCWINSDDVLRPGALAQAARHLTDGARPAWLIGAAEVLEVDGQVREVRRPRVLRTEELLDWRQHWFAQQAVFWTRAMWRSAGPLRTDLHYAMDYDLWLRMLRRSPPLLVPDVLGGYRHHADAKCIADHEAALREMLRVTLRHLPDFLPPAERTEWRARTARSVYERVRHHYWNRQYSDALAELRLMVRIAPGLLREPEVRRMALQTLAEARALRRELRRMPRVPQLPPAPQQSRPITFVLPGGLSLSGVVGWVTQFTGHLAQAGATVNFIEHVSDHPSAEAALAGGARVVPCGGASTAFAGVADVVEYLPAYHSVCPSTISPNWSVAAYAACALIRSQQPDAMRVVGYAHSDEQCYYYWLALYEPIIDLFVAVSDEIAAKLKGQMPNRAADIVVRPYSVECPEALERTYAAPAQPLRLVYAGRVVEQQKRVTDLVLLARALTQRGVPFVLDVVGDGEDLPLLQRHLAESPPEVRDRVRLRGRVPFAEMPCIWRAADICVLTSAFEGTSVAMLEAMAQGCVPVVTRVSGVAAVLIEGENGFVAPIGDVESMADAIAALGANRERLRAMGARAHDTVRARYSHGDYVRWFRGESDRLWQRPPRTWPASKRLSLAIPPPRGFLVRLVSQEFGMRRKLMAPWRALFGRGDRAA